MQSEPLEELLSSKGELIVGLKFVPAEDSSNGVGGKKSGGSRGCLQVLVKEAKNLTAAKSNGTSDPFCKRYFVFKLLFLQKISRSASPKTYFLYT